MALYIDGKDNVLAPGVNELHLQLDDDVEVILPDGSVFYISGSGLVIADNGRTLQA